jgi:hypothetical protein
MLVTRFFPGMPIAACVLTLALGGCVAAVAPLAQMAATQMAPKPPCMTGPACQTGAPSGSFDEFSKGFGDSFHKLTSLVSDSQPVPPQPQPQPPVK